MQRKLRLEQGIKPVPGKRGRKRLNPVSIDSLAENLHKDHRNSMHSQAHKMSGEHPQL